MEIKHKPATKLPWYASADSVGSRAITNSAIFADVRPTANENVAVYDAAYIAHAANAYPKLVQELRLHNVNAEGEQKQNTPIAILLRELGEIE